MADKSPLLNRIKQRLTLPVRTEVREFAQSLAQERGAAAVLFYGSNLRTGSLEGVLDFYLLRDGGADPMIWPVVSYCERDIDGVQLRAKTAEMTLDTFDRAAAGELTDTTIWARFVQPSALIWAPNESARERLIVSMAKASITAVRLAVALGPQSGTEKEYWRALFKATYQAELRVEKQGREEDILSKNAGHFDGLFTEALDAAGIAFEQDESQITPQLHTAEQRLILNWWKRRRRFGKPLNLMRLAKATTTFEGAARYAAWKIKRHTGRDMKVGPLSERFPLLAAPSAAHALWQHRRSRSD